MSRSSDVRMVDLFAVGLPAVLSAYLLPPVRALQSGGLAVAYRGDRSRRRSAGAVAARRGMARARSGGDPRALLALGGVVLPARSLRHHQLGGQLFRHRLRDRSGAPDLVRAHPRPAAFAARPRPGDRGRARSLWSCTGGLAADRAAARAP